MDNTDCNSRAKRQKLDKHGRGAALQRLKELKEKGVKHKYEVKNLDNIYDTVDESEYSKRVLERQDDDWIVDDDGSGYVEDGREIFDDDLDTESIEAAKKSKNKIKKGISRNPTGPTTKGSISDMFANMSTKKKPEKEVDISADDLLSEILTELETTTTPSLSKTPKFTKLSDNRKNVDTSTILKPLPMKIVKAPESVPKKQSLDMDKNENCANETKAAVVTNIPETFENLDFSKFEEPMEYETLPSCSNKKSEMRDTKIDNVDDFKDEMNSDFMDVDNLLLSAVDEVLQQEEKQPTKLNDIKKLNADEICAAWEDVQLKSNKSNEPEKESQINLNDVNADTIFTSNENDEKIFRFFWWDAYEAPFKPGCVFLFGKVAVNNTQNYVSCCVVVKNIERKLYVLPRKYKYDLKNNVETDEEVSMLDVYNEFKTKFAKGNEFRSRPITKSYCFMIEDVPPTAEYLEVRYPPEHGRIVKDDIQCETIQHIFGTDTNFLELLLIERKIKGPSWLDIKNPIIEENKVSWCKIEIRCENMKDISVTKDHEIIPKPPLVIAAINLRTSFNNSIMQNEILMASCLVQTKYSLDKTAPNPTFSDHFCAIARPSGSSWHLDHNELFKKQTSTKLQKCDTERALLAYFLAMFLKIDPDIIVGHDLIGYQLDFLLQRLTSLRIGNWSRFGKLRIKTMPTRIRNIQHDLCPGRLVCDLKISAKELIKARSFDLNTLCTTVLKLEMDKRVEIDNEQIKYLYHEPQGLRKLMACTMQDTSYILKMFYELNVMPLAVQITNIAGYILSRTLLGGRSERNEYLLLHAFNEKNYVVPDKYGNRERAKNDAGDGETVVENKARKKPQYEGGLVLEPKVGYYNTYILLMDFNSLYPSIIQEYNICFTTMKTGTRQVSQYAPRTLAILPTEIRKLVESRRAIKRLMRDAEPSSDIYMQYNIKQMALKLTANSMYGCLGFSKSRFYAQPLAARITELGRDILLCTKDVVEKLCYEVIYGDTDSVMINTNIKNYEQVMKIGYKIKQEVNKCYRELELDIDGIFKYLLLLKKKKYAALVVTKDRQGKERTVQEIKGLDIVRRDWCQLASKAGKYILNNLLCELNEEERVKRILGCLTSIREKLEQNTIPETDLTITKQLTRDPSAYTDRKSLPHVQVAMRYNIRMGTKRLRQGDMVSYIICEDGTDNPPMQRGYHVDEFKSFKNLKVDMKYYISQQIYPLVSRICEPLEFIRTEDIANCLGMDAVSLLKKNLKPLEDVVHVENIFSTVDKFLGTEPFTFKCVNCATINEVKEPVRVKGEFDVKPFLAACTNADCTVEPLEYIKSIQNQLTLSIRRYITRYYESKLICEDPSCDYTTTIVPKLLIREQYPLCDCKNGSLYREYDERELYKQLTFFLYIFDIGKVKKKPLLTPAMQSAYDALKSIVEKYLSFSGFANIDLSKLFATITMKTTPVYVDEDEEGGIV